MSHSLWRNCGRKAAPDHRLYHVCHEQQLARESERNLCSRGNQQRHHSIRRKSYEVQDPIDKSRHR